MTHLTIFLVYRNVDMTEGRGPMVVDSVWVSRQKAIDYMNTKLGVMGRSPFYTNHVTGHVSKGWHDKEAWPSGGDWEVRDWTSRDGIVI